MLPGIAHHATADQARVAHAMLKAWFVHILLPNGVLALTVQERP
jgi:hypothetical protein